MVGAIVPWNDIASRYEQIGDVRGAGLYIGVEMVSDREAKAPDGSLTLPGMTRTSLLPKALAVAKIDIRLRLWLQCCPARQAVIGPECVKTPSRTLAMISEDFIAGIAHEALYPR